MKSLLLIGDSIRQTYDRHVQAALAGQAEVYLPESARFSAYTLYQLVQWKDKLQIPDDLDVIHWNTGLWDVVRFYGEDTHTSPEQYAGNLHRICQRLRRQYPKAEMIFATSTPVQEELYGPVFLRHNEDIVQFNQIAVDVVSQYGMQINDLHTLMSGVPKSYFSDVTHYYTPEATKLFVDTVLQTVCPKLGIDYASLHYEPDFSVPVFLGK